MKKFMTILCAILMMLCVSFAFVGCIDVKSENPPTSSDEKISTSDDKKLSVSNEIVSIDYNEFLGYSVKVTGYIKNTTGKDLSYISVEYKIYDSLDAIVGTALANANSIGAGETWKFEAHSFSWFDVRPTTVKFSEIQTIKSF